jgi:hypothetical protein
VAAGLSKYGLGMTFLKLSQSMSIGIVNIGITAYKFNKRQAKPRCHEAKQAHMQISLAPDSSRETKPR